MARSEQERRFLDKADASPRIHVAYVCRWQHSDTANGVMYRLVEFPERGDFDSLPNLAHCPLGSEANFFLPFFFHSQRKERKVAKRWISHDVVTEVRERVAAYVS